MSFRISGEEAYQTYEKLKLRKHLKKGASLENIAAILTSFSQEFRVEVNPKPTDPVSYTLHPKSIYEIETILVLY